MTLKEYKIDIISRDEKSGDELRNHLISYIAVNIGIFLLNMWTSAEFPWFLFVAGGWGIGMASHWGVKLITTKNLKELEFITDIDETETDKLIAFHKAREAFYLHTISNVAVSIYLLTINIITSTVFMWALIPIMGMGIGVASHWGSYTTKKRRNNFGLTSDNIITEIQENLQLQGTYELRDQILDKIADIQSKFKNFGSDLIPKIDTYVETVAMLIDKESSLGKTLKKESSADLLSEKSRIEEKISSTESENLKKEYETLIEDLDAHLVTIEKLKEQRELLELKITSSINNLKHLNLELSGMKSNTTWEDNTVLKDFEVKSTELSQYYKDLIESYEELHR